MRLDWVSEFPSLVGVYQHYTLYSWPDMVIQYAGEPIFLSTYIYICVVLLIVSVISGRVHVVYVAVCVVNPPFIS